MASNRTILKGDIYHITDGDVKPTGAEIWSDRPALVISNDIANKYSQTVTIVYLRTERKNKPVRPTQVPIMSAGKKALALCEQLYTIDKSRIAQYIGHITDEEMKSVESTLMFQFAIHPNRRPVTCFKKWERYIVTYNQDIDEYSPEAKKQTIWTTDAKANPLVPAPSQEISKDDYINLLENEIDTLKGELNKYRSLLTMSKQINKQIADIPVKQSKDKTTAS